MQKQAVGFPESVLILTHVDSCAHMILKSLTLTENDNLKSQTLTKIVIWDVKP